MISNYSTHRIAITPGEPAGIGPDLTIQLAQRHWPVELVVCADGELLYRRAAQIGLPLKLIDYNPDIEPHPQQAGSLTLLQINTKQPVIAGSLEIDNSIYVVNTLIRACEGCLNKEFLALITGPVHKGIINDAGILFTGHTEFFAKLAGCNRVVMMLATKEMRVALATTHLPLKDVSTAISYDCLYEVINILHYDMRRKFAILNPNIFVCGLNPHAGESGHLGREEIEIIIPVINELRQQGMQLTGPLPADTMFQPKYLQQANVVLAMYHDQGLPVLKFHSFSRAVNITLGLPFIRTSVDHGTALELAGLGVVSPKSFITAINLALSILKNSNEQSSISESLFS